jgi:hypothetical protein
MPNERDCKRYGLPLGVVAAVLLTVACADQRTACRSSDGTWEVIG